MPFDGPTSFATGPRRAHRDPFPGNSRQAEPIFGSSWVAHRVVCEDVLCRFASPSFRAATLYQPVSCHPGCITPLEAKMLVRVQSPACPPSQCDCRLDCRGDGRTCRADAQRSSHASLEALLRFKLSSGGDFLPEAPHACGVLTWCCPSQHWKTVCQEGPCTPLQHLREHMPERWLSSLCSKAAGVALSSKSLDIQRFVRAALHSCRPLLQGVK